MPLYYSGHSYFENGCCSLEPEQKCKRADPKPVRFEKPASFAVPVRELVQTGRLEAWLMIAFHYVHSVMDPYISVGHGIISRDRSQFQPRKALPVGIFQPQFPYHCGNTIRELIYSLNNERTKNICACFAMLCRAKLSAPSLCRVTCSLRNRLLSRSGKQHPVPLEPSQLAAARSLNSSQSWTFISAGGLQNRKVKTKPDIPGNI